MLKDWYRKILDILIVILKQKRLKLVKFMPLLLSSKWYLFDTLIFLWN
jgi:hypothetical protein